MSFVLQVLICHGFGIGKIHGQKAGIGQGIHILYGKISAARLVMLKNIPAAINYRLCAKAYLLPTNLYCMLFENAITSDKTNQPPGTNKTSNTHAPLMPKALMGIVLGINATYKTSRKYL